MVHIYSGTLPAIKKEQSNAICSNRDESRDYHTEWSKSDTERQIYDIAYMWHPEKKGGVQMNLLKNRSRVMDVENKLTVTRG